MCVLFCFFCSFRPFLLLSFVHLGCSIFGLGACDTGATASNNALPIDRESESNGRFRSLCPRMPLACNSQFHDQNQ